MSEVCIRRFEKEDLDRVTKIAIEAFGSKYGKLPKIKPDKFYHMVKDTLDQGDHMGNIVAEVEDQVVGFLHLYSPRLPTEKSKTNWIKFIKDYGIKDTVRFLLRVIILNFIRIKHDELYVSHIAVSSECRGKGVGARLLAYGEEEARKNQEIKKYTLYVWKKNISAYKFYMHYGFRDVSHLKSMLFEKIIGYRTAILVVKTLGVN